jgi:hypothetical protein
MAVPHLLPRRRFQSLGELLVHAVVDGPFEAHSIARLASLRRLTVRTLQRRCCEARTTAKACVDFVRCLQIILDTTTHWDPAAQLSLCAADTRTINRILVSAGLRTETRPTLDGFLGAQRLIVCDEVLDDIRRRLATLTSKVA